MCNPLDGLDKECLSEELTFERASERSRGALGMSGEKLLGREWLVCLQSSKEAYEPGAG